MHPPEPRMIEVNHLAVIEKRIWKRENHTVWCLIAFGK